MDRPAGAEVFAVYRNARTIRHYLGLAPDEAAAQTLATRHAGRHLTFRLGRAEASAPVAYSYELVHLPADVLGAVYSVCRRTRTRPLTLLDLRGDAEAAMRSACRLAGRPGVPQPLAFAPVAADTWEAPHRRSRYVVRLERLRPAPPTTVLPPAPG